MSTRALKATLAAACTLAVAILPAIPAHADQVRNEQWHLRFLDTEKAHSISQGEGITVAVIDTGVDPHPDLRNNLLPGIDVASGGLGNGQGDERSHGTGMAGLIAAHGKGPGVGALGIAPRAKIIPIRDETSSDAGNGDKIAQGIRHAITRQAKVISISSSSNSSGPLIEAVAAAIAADIVVVAGAGNSPQSLGVTFPAAIKGVVAVGATDREGNRAAVSVTGKQISLVAPGVEIRSTGNNGSYRIGTGTSNSTAIVAGAAALVRSKYPEMSAEEVVHRLTATAADRGAPGRDEEYGYGLLDLVAALTADVPPLKPAAASATPTPIATDATALPDTGDSNDGGFSGALVIFGALVIVAIGIALAILMLYLRRRTT